MAREIRSLRADGAHNISGKLVQDFCKENKIILVKSIPYRPETNGIASGAIRSIKEWFCKNKDLGDWDELIEKCLFDLNRVTSESQQRPTETPVKRNARFQVGDRVILTRRRKVGKFPEGLGIIDTVIAVTGSNSVELENNGIQSNKDLVKK